MTRRLRLLGYSPAIVVPLLAGCFLLGCAVSVSARRPAQTGLASRTVSLAARVATLEPTPTLIPPTVTPEPSPTATPEPPTAVPTPEPTATAAAPAATTRPAQAAGVPAAPFVPAGPPLVPVNVPPAATCPPLLPVAPASPPRVRLRPMIVQIDNAIPARPPINLTAADVMYEYVAEGGVTRFSAVFTREDVGIVGPVRSARLISLEIARMLEGVLVYHGASIGVQDRLWNG